MYRTPVQRRPRRTLAITLAALGAAAGMVSATCPRPALAENWPGFRGPGGLSISMETNLPTEWSTDKNVKWRIDLPARGNSSPVIWGDRVLVTQAVGERRQIMCFARADGKELWTAGVTYSEPEPTHNTNPYCSATPATDGERVVASFGSAGLFCCDLDGKELWRRDLGNMNHMFGNASSPVIVGDLVVLNAGPGETRGSSRSTRRPAR